MWNVKPCLSLSYRSAVFPGGFHAISLVTESLCCIPTDYTKVFGRVCSLLSHTAPQPIGGECVLASVLPPPTWWSSGMRMVTARCACLGLCVRMTYRFFSIFQCLSLPTSDQNRHSKKITMVTTKPVRILCVGGCQCEKFPRTDNGLIHSNMNEKP